jgi:hypothetical protein
VAGAVLALALAWAALALLPADARGDGLRDSGLERAELDLKLEDTHLIRQASYHGLPPIGENGEMGRNLHNPDLPFWVADQQLGDIFIRAGIVRHKRWMVERGLQAFDYAFFHQDSDGSFNTGQAEAYAFFVEAVAHSIELLRESRYAWRYEDRLKEYIPRLRSAADHMVASDAWDAFEHRNRSYTHSGYVMGTALSLTARLTGSNKLRRYGSRAIRLAVKRQCCGGVNPELGGYDVRYQAAGLVWAERYRVYFPGGRLSSRVERMIDRALEWMRPRVDRDGWIDWRGSTRTCRETNSNGNPKTPGYAFAIRAFAYWGRLTGSKGLLREANRMLDYLERHGGEASLCGPKQSARAQAAPDERRGGAETLGGARLEDLYE